MKKLLTNGEIYNIGITIFGDNGILKRNDLKTTIAIRHMFKLNAKIIENNFSIVQEEINDTIRELFEEFRKCGKTHIVDDEEAINNIFIDEFRIEQQKRLDEVSLQTIEVDFATVSESDVTKYFTINDGKLTNYEMDIVEMFIE